MKYMVFHGKYLRDGRANILNEAIEIFGLDDNQLTLFTTKLCELCDYEMQHGRLKIHKIKGYLYVSVDGDNKLFVDVLSREKFIDMYTKAIDEHKVDASATPLWSMSSCYKAKEDVQ